MTNNEQHPQASSEQPETSDAENKYLPLLFFFGVSLAAVGLISLLRGAWPGLPAFIGEALGIWGIPMAVAMIPYGIRRATSKKHVSVSAFYGFMFVMMILLILLNIMGAIASS